MDSSSSPSHPGLGGAGAETHHDEDQEMADAPSHSYIRSQFIPVTSAPASPEPPKVMETTEKPAVPGKKKGQAAAVKKAPKRGKGGTTGGPKQSKKVANKAPASDASVNSGAEAEADGDAADSDEGDESDHGPYCICRGPDDHRFMIGCDVCEDWFHGECVGIDKDVGEHLIERFVCPNCSNRDEGIITVFKKTCGLPRCKKPARLYDGQPKEERSHFCSDEHKQLWWERCLSTLPKKKNPGSKVPEALTQGEFVAILESGLATFQDTAAGTPAVSGGDATMSDSVEDTNGDEQKAKDPVNGLTPEQQEILAHCASERARIAKEINTWHQMSHVLEWASIRRKKLIAAGLLDDAACGYDFRLDTIGARAPFEKWLDSEDGHALFDGVADGMGATALGPNVPLTADPKEICDKKRCKAHQGWFALLKRDLNLHQSQCSGVITKHLEREFNIEESARQRLARMAGAEVAGK